ncbi:MAG: SulP family inorganic anion transporter, partial [Actinomycetota bacterium]
MVEQRRSQGVLLSLVAGLVIGAVETVFAVGFAAFVFGGYLEDSLPDGLTLYLAAAALTLAFFAWRTGHRGVVGSLQGAVAAVLAVVATTTALDAFGGPERAFLTVVAATLVVTILAGVAFLVLGTLRRGNLIRFVPYPVVGGFLAGIGWLLVKGGVSVASRVTPSLDTIGDLTESRVLQQWVGA